MSKPPTPAVADRGQARETLDAAAVSAHRLHLTSTAREGLLLLVTTGAVGLYFSASFLGIRAAQLPWTSLLILFVAASILGVVLPYLVRQHRTIRPLHFPAIETGAVVAVVLLALFQLRRLSGERPATGEALALGFASVIPLAACGLWLVFRRAFLRARESGAVAAAGRRGNAQFSFLTSLTGVHSASPASLAAALGLTGQQVAEAGSRLERKGWLLVQERLISPRDTAEIRLSTKGRAACRDWKAGLEAAAGAGP